MNVKGVYDRPTEFEARERSVGELLRTSEVKSFKFKRELQRPVLGELELAPRGSEATPQSETDRSRTPNGAKRNVIKDLLKASTGA